MIPSLPSDQFFSQKQKKAIHVFCSYAHEDKALRDQLEIQLSTLKRIGLITVWHDQEVVPGTNREHQIDTHLNSADIILLLLSSNFIASDYCYSQEMERALERHKGGEVCVLPILLRHVHWEDTPLRPLQILPPNAKPVTAWSNPDEALFKVVDVIRDIAITLQTQKERKYWMAEGECQAEAGKYENAERAYAMILRRFPNHSDNAIIYQHRANLLRLLMRYQDAAEMYQKAITLNPTDSSLYHAFGDILRKLAREDEALNAYTRAIEHDPKNAQLHQKQGDILSNLARYEEALASYNNALENDPTQIMVYLNKGYVLRCLQRYSDALKIYHQALQQDPANTVLPLLEGTVLCELKSYDAAVEAYDHALTLDATSALAHYGRAFALAHLAKASKVSHQAEQALKAAKMLGDSELFHPDSELFHLDEDISKTPTQLIEPHVQSSQSYTLKSWHCSLCHAVTDRAAFCHECGGPTSESLSKEA